MADTGVRRLGSATPSHSRLPPYKTRVTRHALRLQTDAQFRVSHLHPPNMAFRQTIRPLTSNLGAVAAVSIGAGLAYTYYKPKPTVFGSFNPTYLRLESTEDVSHNTKRLRFALPHPTDQTGLPLTCAPPLPPPRNAW